MYRTSSFNRSRLALSACMAAFLAACGGGGISTSDQAKTAYFIDSAVEGLQYKSGSQSGLTGSDGSFKYEEGKPVTFSIGGLELGSVTVVNQRVFPVDLISGANDETHPKVSLLAQILQTLDSDGNPANGITITASTRQAIGQAIQASSADPTQTAAALTQLMATATNGRATTLVTAEQAKNHLQAGLLKEYAGRWTGSFTGGDVGNCKVDITETGSVSGSCTSTALNGQSFTLGGTVTSSGSSTASSGGASTGATFSGNYTRGGKVTGTWSNPNYNIQGTWSLSKN